MKFTSPDPTPTEPAGSADGGLSIPESAGVEQLFTIITKLSDDNKATIGRIDACAERDVKHFAYSSPPVVSAEGDVCKFTLTEEPAVEAAGELVKSWKGEVRINGRE